MPWTRRCRSLCLPFKSLISLLRGCFTLADALCSSARVSHLYPIVGKSRLMALRQRYRCFYLSPYGSYFMHLSPRTLSMLRAITAMLLVQFARLSQYRTRWCPWVVRHSLSHSAYSAKSKRGERSRFVGRAGDGVTDKGEIFPFTTLYFADFQNFSFPMSGNS